MRWAHRWHVALLFNLWTKMRNHKAYTWHIWCVGSRQGANGPKGYSVEKDEVLGAATLCAGSTENCSETGSRWFSFSIAVEPTSFLITTFSLPLFHLSIQHVIVFLGPLSGRTHFIRLLFFFLEYVPGAMERRTIVRLCWSDTLSTYPIRNGKICSTT